MFPFINLFGLYVDSAYFFWGIGIIAAQIYYQIFCKKYGFKWYQSLLFGFLFLVFEMIGAKILYIAENFNYVLENGISFGGFSFFGIMFSVPLLTWILSKFAKIPYGKLMDFASVGILFELAFYRIGCTCAGCCRGLPFSFGMVYPSGETLFPVQPIEASLDIILAVVLIVLYSKKKLRNGEQYLLYMSGYGVIRFILEFLRERDFIVSVFSLSHVWAALAFSIGVLLLICSRGKNKCKKDNSI